MVRSQLHGGFIGENISTFSGSFMHYCGFDTRASAGINWIIYSTHLTLVNNSRHPHTVYHAAPFVLLFRLQC